MDIHAIISRLSIAPYGTDVFTDLNRGKEFCVLFFRRKETSYDQVYTYIESVLADVLRAGLLIGGNITIELAPRKNSRRPRYQVSVEVPIEVPIEVSIDVSAETITPAPAQTEATPAPA